ncbi:MAG: alpha-L-fucosidase [Bacteroidota bacterium]|nr:alpha-L-fucosidase [Bacteroidota bacterium]
MKRRTLIKTAITAIPAIALSGAIGACNFLSEPEGESVAPGPFKPSWESLQNFQVPDWFRDAKFGIWAHWGPQCQPEHGDWYARSMYIEGDDDYNFHIKKYGHPSKFGFKDVINQWTAERWEPEHLVKLYKNAGAKYFFAMANHHDNFDNYDSKYQSWNAVGMGPKKDIIGGWAKAAKNNDLHFGVSVHAAHAWSFYEKSQKADKTGPFAGIPYDGRITKESGKGKWWDGFDPQELYAQQHKPSPNADNQEIFFQQWDWKSGVTVPDKKYCEKFFNRTVDLINKYNPDIVYFDDTILPLYPISDAGLRIAAHLYNHSISQNNGKLQAVITGKVLNEQQRKCMVWDIERGQSNAIEPLPWQTDTCLGQWHYDRRIYDKKEYKSAKTIIHTLADVISKNGNFLLNVPVRGDGTIDEEELAIVESIGAWIRPNSESIFGTRPWKIFGEGPASEEIVALSAQGFNEGKGKPFTGQDIRFTAKEDALFAFALGAPENNKVTIKSLAWNSVHYKEEIGKVILVQDSESLTFQRTEKGLEVNLPERLSGAFAYTLKILPL